MLRLNHALPLILLVSVSAFAMDKQLVSTNSDVFAARSPLLDTMMVSKTYEEQKAALTELERRESELNAAKVAKEEALKKSSAEMMALIAAKRTQIDGSVKTLTAYRNELAALQAKAAQEEAALKEKNANAASALQAKIASEEKIKQGFETVLKDLEAQVTPKEEAKAFGPEEAPKASWSLFGWLTRK